MLVAVAALTWVTGAAALPILDQLLGGKPGATTAAATNVTVSSARLNGSVHPNGHGTKYRFEYGPTVAYGATTSEVSVGGGQSWVSAAANVSGLQAATTYHFRVVATNSKGTNRGDDFVFTTSAAPPGDPGPGSDPGDESDPGSGSGTGSGTGTGDPGDDTRDLISGDNSTVPVAPQLGESVVVAPGEGELLVRRPGRSSFVPLAYGSELPVGTEVDASNGSIALTSALPSGKVQTGKFGGGRFVIDQGARGYVDLFLRGRACAPSARSSYSTAGAAKRKPGRRLWGSDHGGRFRTHGKNSHATVRGTRWVVVDTCAGTLTKVSSGAVMVRDEVRRKSVLVKAGERYLAKPPR